ncbi:MAG TPA: NUDIX hydrolase [Ktedonobacteraceae bacterium]|nr:NUDIX hydrolase [Ktedonobacteraceae bacterium]
MAVQPRLASAVMLLRPTSMASEPEQGQGQEREKGRGFEVFMVRRVIQSDFMPDVYVFPGGSVTADDRAAEQTEGICAPVAPSAADPEGRTAPGNGTRAAAIRELFEEAGILLAVRDGQMLAVSSENERRFQQYREAFQQRTGSLVQMATTEHLTLATGLLHYFAHWITPEGMPKRFDTHFFVATAPNEQQAEYDQLETSEGIWIAPAEALARFERGEFPIVFATIYQLRELAAFTSVQDALQYTATHRVPVRQPVLSQQEGAVRVHLPDEADNSWVVPEHMRKQ